MSEKQHVPSENLTVAVDALTARLDHLQRAFAKHNTLRRKFAAGVMWGVGTVIGAGALATLVILIATTVFNAFGWGGVLEDLHLVPEQEQKERAVHGE